VKVLSRLLNLPDFCSRECPRLEERETRGTPSYFGVRMPKAIARRSWPLGVSVSEIRCMTFLLNLRRGRPIPNQGTVRLRRDVRSFSRGCEWPTPISRLGDAKPISATE
jgi:hypothetical protein